MKIRGNTVGTTMKPEKVLEKAGGLSEELAIRDERIASVEASIGDISTALDGIIAIQNELIGNTIIFYIDDLSCNL